MSGTRGLFSLQGIAISLAIHVVLVGALCSFGKKSGSPESAGAVKIAPAGDESKAEPERQTGGKRSPEATSAKDLPPDAGSREIADPEIESARRAEPKVAGPKNEEPKKVEIKIEPRSDDSLAGPAVQKSQGKAAGSAVPQKTRVYVVKRGDTLTALAREAKMTVAELVRLNGGNMKKFSNLRIGQRLKLPVEE
jgi:LysM repeat protein